MTALTALLAFDTIAVWHEPPASTVVQGFIDRIPEEFAAARQSAAINQSIDRNRALQDGASLGTAQ